MIIIYCLVIVVSIHLSICDSFSIQSNILYNSDRSSDTLLLRASSNNNNGPVRSVEPDYEIPKYPKPRQIAADQAVLLGDLSGGRPGSIIETEEQLQLKEKMLIEMEHNIRQYPTDIMKDYGTLVDDDDAEYIYEGMSSKDMPEASSASGDDNNEDNMFLDAETLGTWTIQDLKSKFPYEWDPNSGEPDPNFVEMNIPGKQYVEQNPMDLDDNVEIGYDPIFGPSNPIDTRTILGVIDSYVIDPLTRDEQRLTPQFHTNDVERKYNDDIIEFRKSLDIMETYDDIFLAQDESTNMPVPRHVAKWHGYPEPTFLEPKNFTNNRFTDEADRTDFSQFTPYRARERAVELARSKNAEWLPPRISHQYHIQQRAPYDTYRTLIGTLRKGDCNPRIVTMIQPVLQILGSCCELLSIHEVNNNNNVKEEIATPKMEDSNDDDDIYIFRFAYHGLMKNKHGMKCWTEHMIQECFQKNSNNDDDDDKSLSLGKGSSSKKKKITKKDNDIVASSSSSIATTIPRPNATISVVFETGFRKRDPAYDGGDYWYGPSF